MLLPNSCPTVQHQICAPAEGSFIICLLIAYIYICSASMGYLLIQVNSQNKRHMQDDGIRFLVATDVHLGHREKHPVRHNDSYEGLEEVIEHAKAQKVDFLLLGGDLFDEVNPSKQCFFRCLNIMKQSVFGSRHAGLKVSLNGKEYNSNLENEDLHISLPIFTIHGNHDYPTNEFGKISACDLLQASNYVNYFGKYLNLQNIVIKPLIITKSGSKTKIALYGLGYIKDQVLSELFQDKKVTFEPPEGNLKDYFNIFVLHQNRYKKGFRPGAPIHLSFSPKNIPNWMDLVIWGHEHEAIYKIQYESDLPVYQPGSTILTSYIESESFKKQCVLINAKGNNYEIQSLLLEKSYRPMRCLNYEFKTLQAQFGQTFDFFQYIDQAVQGIIDELAKENPKKPIIRLKIECSGITNMEKVKSIENKYYDKIANGDKMIIFWRRKIPREYKMDEDNDLLNKIKNKEIEKNLRSIADEIETIMTETFEKVETTIFPKKNLLEVVNYLGITDNSSPVEIVKKRCAELEKKKSKSKEEEFIKLLAEKESQVKRALKYELNKKEFYCNDKVDFQSYNNCSEQEFFALKDQIMTENKFMLHCKMMEDFSENKEERQQGDQDNSKSMTINNSSRESIIKRSQHEQRDSSVEIVDRSDSEDCCQRAQRTVFDETGNRARYLQAQQKIKNAMIAKNKKSSLLNTSRQSESKEDKKIMKNVRFSKDFM